MGVMPSSRSGAKNPPGQIDMHSDPHFRQRAAMAFDIRHPLPRKERRADEKLSRLRIAKLEL